MHRHAVSLFAIIAALALSVAPARATWPKLPTQNLAISAAGLNQGSPACVEDGAGGYIVVWRDGVSSFNLYAKHVFADGTFDPSWPAGGRILCPGSGSQQNATIASDGAGGAIVTWEDYRAAPSAAAPDIYAAHVLASGAMDPAWPAAGLAVCTAVKDQLVPTIVPDGAGGAVIAWQDDRVFYDVYAQHVLASGVVDPAWPVNGRALCTATDGQGSQTMVSDGAGGAIVAWHDFRTGTQWDIYAQHVLASGAVDPAWPLDGRALCTAASHQTFPATITDGSGGAIVTWEDRRSGSYAVYAQHVFSSGAVDPAWPANGVAVGAATTVLVNANNNPRPRLAPDGAGGALVTWQDDRNAGVLEVYLQHVTGTGVADPAWPANGRALCPNPWAQTMPLIVADPTGSAIVAWSDDRVVGYPHDLYCQRVVPGGTIDPAWPAGGLAIGIGCGADSVCAVSDGQRGLLCAWRDSRNGNGGNVGIPHIYGQRVWPDGMLGPTLPVITSVTDVPADQGGFVTVRWDANYFDPDPAGLHTVTQYTLWRELPAAAAARAIAAGTRANEGASGPGALRTTNSAAGTVYWEYLGATAANGSGSYSSLAATFADLTFGVPNTMTYMVLAEAAPVFWQSAPVTGLSVDNLAPLPPVGLQSYFTGSEAQLNWQPNTEPDLKGYRIYFGSTPDFTADMNSFVGQTSSTHFTNAAEIAFYYRVTALDVHGNESTSTLLTLGILGVGNPAPTTAEGLAAARPNPASLTTTMHFTLPRPGNVRLAIYDAAGRAVRGLVDGAQPAGDQDRTWDLRDAAGHEVGPGLYFARLVVEGREHVRRVVVTR